MKKIIEKHLCDLCENQINDYYGEMGHRKDYHEIIIKSEEYDIKELCDDCYYKIFGFIDKVKETL